MTNKISWARIVVTAMSIMLIAVGCSSGAEVGNNDPGTNTPDTNPPGTTAPVTTAPPMPTAVGNFMCELKEYPETIWPLYKIKNIEERQNNFWMEVYYPADYVYPDIKFYFGIQYSSAATEAEVLKHYYDRVEAHQINAFSDVQGYIGDWEVYADAEASFYTGEQNVSVMVGNNKIVYQSNPYFTDFPTTLFPAYQLSVPLSDIFYCWSNSKEYYRRYENTGSVADAVSHYRNLMQGATGFTENTVTGSIGTSITLKGNLAGYKVEIVVRDWNDLITVNLEKLFS
ncbi:MAG: hypothetical protein P3T54_08125 [Dehalogenimonas sp.]|uniref:Lipoprotein n=1 Tax=Candidatus Dehalogenimonas loeffleri TaxID=3127115 RepID=A0ABZ2JB81_9CHLR|nr:hypothetical protein [Dehalogenimonas sp.]